jgi:hypothetical protein
MRTMRAMRLRSRLMPPLHRQQMAFERAAHAKGDDRHRVRGGQGHRKGHFFGAFAEQHQLGGRGVVDRFAAAVLVAHAMAELLQRSPNRCCRAARRAGGTGRWAACRVASAWGAFMGGSSLARQVRAALLRA